jgi:hypothetical protein
MSHQHPLALPFLSELLLSPYYYKRVVIKTEMKPGAGGSGL